MISTSKFPTAALSSCPFFRPLNPASSTVETVCPAKSRLRRRGTHSSSSSLILRHQPLPVLFEHAERLLPRHGREIVEKDIQTVPAFQIIEQVLDGDSRAREDRRSAQLL